MITNVNVDETKKLKAIMVIMNPGNRYRTIQPRLDRLTYINTALYKVVPNPEKCSLGGRSSNYQFSNCSRKEGYALNANSTQPLPTRINEKNFIKAMDLLTEAFGQNVCVNLILVKEPKKINWSVAYLQIVDSSEVWVF